MTTTKWNIDPTHSEVQFKVKHLMITNVTGSFGTFNAEVITSGDSLENAEVNFTADINSINTGNEQRDGHLKGDDFFSAEKFPQLKFSASEIKKEGEHYKVKGNLTLRDVTQPVELKVEEHGVAKDPWGNVKMGLSFEGKINRKDFGLQWNAVTETGGFLLSEEVKLLGDVQLVKQS